MTAFVVAGLVIGGIYAISALCLTVTYTCSRIFNFAQGGTAYFVASLYYQLVVIRGWSVVAGALVSVIVVGGTLGFLLWALIFRHLANSSTVTRVSVTIGLQVALVSLAVVLFGNTLIFNPMAFFAAPVPTFEVFGVVLNADQATILGFAAGIALLLAVVLRFTAAGLVLRAVVDSPTTATRMGTNPQVVTAVTWVLTTMLVGLCGVLLAPIIGLQAESYSAFVAISAAGVVVARYTSIEGAFFAALGLGVVQSVISQWVPTTGVLGNGLRPGLPFVVIFTAIFVYSITGRLREADERVIVANEFRGKRMRNERRYQKLGSNRDRGRWDTWVGWALAPLIVLFLVTQLSSYWIGLLATGLAVAIVMISWKAVTYESRVISLAQISFAGVGAAMAGLFATELGLPTLLAVLVGALCAGFFGAVLGLLVLSSGALNAALATFALGLFVDSVVFNIPRINPFSAGLPLDPIHIGSLSFLDKETAFVGILLIFVLIALGLRALDRSTVGSAYACLRNSPDRARTLGIKVHLYRVAACALGGAIAGLGGGIYASLQGTTFPDYFFSAIGLVWFAVMMSNGLGSTGGALVAGLAVTIMPAVLDKYTSPDVVEILPVLFGLGAILLTLMPEGNAARSRAAVRRLAVRLELLFLFVSRLFMRDEPAPPTAPVVAASDGGIAHGPAGESAVSGDARDGVGTRS